MATEMKIILFVLCFVLKTQVNSQVLQFGDCPVVQTVKLFDIERFLGTWHVIERFPSWYEEDGICAHKHIKACGNRLIQFQHVFVREDIQYILYVNSTYNPGDEAVFEIETNNVDPIGIPLSVVATDYTEYAILYGCKVHVYNIRYTVAWILSRNMTLPPEIFEEARSTLTAIPYASHVFLKPVQQDPTLCDHHWTAHVHTENTGGGED